MQHETPAQIAARHRQHGHGSTAEAIAARHALHGHGIPATDDTAVPGAGSADALDLCGLLPQQWMRDACRGLTNGGGGGGGGDFPGVLDCPPGFEMDFLSPEPRCVPINGTDPTPIGTTPGEGTSGIRSPSAVQVRTLRCPKYADNRMGILWMSALTGEVVCLPRGVNGKGFGLIRKNTPRRKAVITAAQGKQLDVSSSLKKKIKELSGKAGFSCETKAAAAGRRAREKSGR